MRDKLRAARKAADLTQQAMADKLCISLQHYKFIESRQSTGNVELWDKMEDLFNIHQRVLREIRPGKRDNP